MILIAGPYRSGTDDDPALIKKNVQQMESYATYLPRRLRARTHSNAWGMARTATGRVGWI